MTFIFADFIFQVFKDKDNKTGHLSGKCPVFKVAFRAS